MTILLFDLIVAIIMPNSISGITTVKLRVTYVTDLNPSEGAINAP